MSTKVWENEESELSVKYFTLPKQKPISFKNETVQSYNTEKQYSIILKNFLEDMTIMGTKKENYFNDDDPSTLVSLEDISPDLLFTFDEDDKTFAFSTETIKDIYQSQKYINPITQKSMEHLKDRIDKVGKIVIELFPTEKQVLEMSENNLLKLYSEVLVKTKKVEIPIQSKWIVNLNTDQFSKFTANLKIYVNNNNHEVKDHANKIFFNKKYNDILEFKWEFAKFLKAIFEYAEKKNGLQMFIYTLISALNEVCKECVELYPDIHASY